MSTTPDVSVLGKETLVSTTIPTTYPHYTEDEFRVLMEKMKRERERAEGLQEDSAQTLQELEIPSSSLEPNSEVGIKENANNILKRANDLLRAHNQATDRVVATSYGICLGCESRHVIPFEQMLAAPLRIMCVKATQIQEDKSPYNKVN